MIVLDDNEQIIGLAVVRTMMKKDCEKESHSLVIDPEGDTYMVDLAIALNPKREVLQLLGFMGLKRFGQRNWMAFQKNGQGPLKYIDARKHREKIMRIHREHAH